MIIDYGGLTRGEVAEIAFLYEEGWFPKDIAEKVGIGMPTVYRVINRLVDTGVIETRVSSELLDNDTRASLENLFHRAQNPHKKLEALLKQASSGIFKRLHVVFDGETAPNTAGTDTTEDGATSDEWRRRLIRFARNAAPVVFRELIKSHSGIGVSWGSTIRYVMEAIVRHMSVYGNVQPEPDDFLIIPTAGKPISDRAPGLDISSTGCAQLCSDFLKAKELQVLSLMDVPSVVGLPIGQSEFERARIESNTNYKNIFIGDRESKSVPLIQKIDTIVTSAGAFHNWTIFTQDYMRQHRVTTERLKKVSVGDIGGVLIPRAENNKKKTEEFEWLSGLWTGIKLEDYQRTAKQAAANTSDVGPAGSVLVCIGSNKSRIVAELTTRTKVVNTLICCERIAHDLTQILAGSV